MVTIYVLLLEQNRYYVGKTSNINQIHYDYGSHNESEWTKLYKPLFVLAEYNNCDDSDEDKYTIITMAKYGIDRVRGGSFSDVQLTELDEHVIYKLILKEYSLGKNDLSLFDHSKSSPIEPEPILKNNPVEIESKVKLKPKDRPKSSSFSVLVSNFFNKLFTNSNNSNSSNNSNNINEKVKVPDSKPVSSVTSDTHDFSKISVICDQCGRIGHPFTECNSKYHVNGYSLKNSTSDLDIDVVLGSDSFDDDVK